jgi:tripartite-type tricarboxylate transporter receptor subunit TctC
MRVCILTLLALGGLISTVFAQPYPHRVVRVVVAYPAGGSIDVVSRLVNQRLATALGQQFIIENRAGAAGNIGTDYVAKAAPDGYVLLMGSAASISSAPAVYAKLPYDPVRDLSPIIQVANQPNVLTAHPSVPAKTLKEFIALAKAHPGKFNYGSSGIGASQHMTAELFAMQTGVKIEHIPYKGGTPAMTDLISGQIDFMFTPAPNAIAFVKSGKIRGIAVTSLKRSSALPELPTMDESGLQGFELLGWIGLLGPFGTPREIVDRLNAETRKMLAGDIRLRLTGLGLDAVGGTPEQFAAFIRQDIAKYAKIVKVAAIPPQ